MSEELGKPIVIDNGTGLTKVGFAGEDSPRYVFPTLIGYPKHATITDVGAYQKEYFIGDEAQRLRGVLKLVYPIEHGIITDWDALKKIWAYTFYDLLRVDPSEHPVLLTEAPLNPRQNREKMAEIMFNEFNVPALYVAMQAALSLYASGRTTGLVVDIGDGVTHIVPIWEGFAIDKGIKRVNLAGRDITRYLLTLLYQRGYQFESSAEFEIVRDIKEKMCYVALDLEKELQVADKMGAAFEKPYILPNGETLMIGAEMFLAPEVLFNPGVIGKETEPLHKLILSSIRSCAIDLQRDLLANIVLSGGTTMLKGLKERLYKEIKEEVPENVEVKIIAPVERATSVWIGGSILASLSGFSRYWVTKKEIEEKGIKIIHRCTM